MSNTVTFINGGYDYNGAIGFTVAPIHRNGNSKVVWTSTWTYKITSVNELRKAGEALIAIANTLEKQRNEVTT